MATYESLTGEEKAVLQAAANLIRGWTGEQARTNNHAEAIDDDYNGQTSAILGSLDTGEVVPNTSGLVGAGDLTKDELVTLMSHVQGVLTNYNTAGHRQLWARAAGAANLIG